MFNVPPIPDKNRVPTSSLTKLMQLKTMGKNCQDKCSQADKCDYTIIKRNSYGLPHELSSVARNQWTQDILFSAASESVDENVRVLHDEDGHSCDKTL